MNRCFCEECRADLRGPSIPTEGLYMYGGNATCDGCGDALHYSRLIGVYDPDRDRTVVWRCPDCGHEETRPQVLNFRSEARRD